MSLASLSSPAGKIREAVWVFNMHKIPGKNRKTEAITANYKPQLDSFGSTICPGATCPERAHWVGPSRQTCVHRKSGECVMAYVPQGLSS